MCDRGEQRFQGRVGCYFFFLFCLLRGISAVQHSTRRWRPTLNGITITISRSSLRGSANLSGVDTGSTGWSVSFRRPAPPAPGVLCALHELTQCPSQSVQFLIGEELLRFLQYFIPPPLREKKKKCHGLALCFRNINRYNVCLL